MRRFDIHWCAVVLVVACFLPALAYANQNVEDPAATQQAIPFKQQPTTPEGSLSRIALVFLFAIGLCLAVVIVLKKTMQYKGMLGAVSGTRIKVVESKRITPRLMAFLIDVDGEEYLLAQSGDHLQLTAHNKDKVINHSNES